MKLYNYKVDIIESTIEHDYLKQLGFDWMSFESEMIPILQDCIIPIATDVRQGDFISINLPGEYEFMIKVINRTFEDSSTILFRVILYLNIDGNKPLKCAISEYNYSSKPHRKPSSPLPSKNDIIEIDYNNIKMDITEYGRADYNVLGSNTDFVVVTVWERSGVMFLRLKHPYKKGKYVLCCSRNHYWRIKGSANDNIKQQ